jgi:hypothetical protein
MDQLKVPFGAYVGTVGTGVKDNKQVSWHLDFLEPYFKEEPVVFSSKDMLLDAAGTPAKFSDSVIEDLNLDPKKSKKLLDMAVTLDRFGELVELDAGSIKSLDPARERVKEERTPYDDIKVSEAKQKKAAKEAKEASSSLDGAMKDGKKPKKKRKRGRADNPLKGGFGPSSGMMMPGMGMPPGMSPPTIQRSRPGG